VLPTQTDIDKLQRQREERELLGVMLIENAQQMAYEPSSGNRYGFEIR
jgi:hypothetical protein